MLMMTLMMLMMKKDDIDSDDEEAGENILSLRLEGLWDQFFFLFFTLFRFCSFPSFGADILPLWGQEQSPIIVRAFQTETRQAARRHSRPSEDSSVAGVAGLRTEAMTKPSSDFAIKDTSPRPQFVDSFSSSFFLHTYLVAVLR